MSERGMDYAQRPTDEEVFDYQREYVKKVADGDILETLRIQREIAVPWIQAIPASEADAVHEPYGWSIWQVIQHCVDAERVFGYRALRFATGDQTELPGWDENRYAAVAYAPGSSLVDLATEFSLTRESNLALLRRLSLDAWNEIGCADGRQVSVRALSWLMAGHWIHHERILRKRLNQEANGSLQREE
jgi:hypothetical protein